MKLNNYSTHILQILQEVRVSCDAVASVPGLPRTRCNCARFYAWAENIENGEGGST